MEHLFKLKKDGKTVGYEKHALLKPDNAIIILHSKHTDWSGLGSYNIISHPTKYISHDEKCPFVTKDKNGNDVFAGDKANVQSPNLPPEGIGEATLQPRIAVPLSSHTEYYNPQYWDIELIEDNND